MKISYVLGVAFQQVFARAYLFYFPDIDERLNRISLKIVILEESAGAGFVAGFEPVVQESLGSVGDAFAPASLPRLDRLAERRNTSARAAVGCDVEEAGLIVIRGFLASRHVALLHVHIQKAFFS